MRFAGIGLLVGGAAVAIIGGVAADEASGALVCIIAGGFMFVAGAVFAASAGIQDAVRNRSTRKD